MSSGPWRPDERGNVRDRLRRRRLQVPRLSLSDPFALEPAGDRDRWTARLRLLEGLALVLVMGLLLGFWQLQIVNGAEYDLLARNRYLRSDRILAPRGLILDRNHVVLVNNRASYEVMIVHEDIDKVEETLAWLSHVLEQPVAELRERLDRHRDVPRFRPVAIADEVPLSTVADIESRRLEHPGVTIRVHAKRSYPQGSLAAHLLGYVGEISREQLESWDENRYRMGDIVGNSGVERQYNGELSGSAGQRLRVVNAFGREMQVLDEDPPEPGMTLVLTLDIGLQRVVESLLEGREGAIVVLDVRDGSVLAMASAPTFDPNAFAARFTEEEWLALRNDPARPLQNRALSAGHPPGSVFKLVMAAASLSENVVSPETIVFCPGGRTLFGRFFRCLNEHGPVNLREAIVRSCNTYFYEVGLMLRRERIVHAARTLGLGQRTGIDLPSEIAGTLPTQEWLDRNHRTWYRGETVSLSIGQGPIDVSPIQLAQLAATVGTGMVQRPHIMASVEAASGAGSRSWSAGSQLLNQDPRVRKTLLAAMADAVTGGTGRAAQIAGTQVGGKTGTAQVVSTETAGEIQGRPKHLRNHAWFVGLAPLDRAEIAVAVLIQHGGQGGLTAAPLAGKIFDAWFNRPGTGDPAVTAATLEQ